METMLAKEEYETINDAIDLMSIEQMVKLMEEIEDQLINKGHSDKAFDSVDSPNDKFKSYSFRRSSLYGGQNHLDQYFPEQKGNGKNNVVTTYKKDKWSSQKNITWQQKKQLDNITDMTKNLYLEFDRKQTARLYALMLAKPSIEWGLYLVFEKKLPNLEEIWAEMTKKNTPKVKQPDYIIPIGDMVIVPQNVTSGNVDYLEQEYPEMMKEVNDYRFKKYKTTGRIHSHHNMSAYHSGTDWGEFNKYLEIGDVYLSLVVATNKKIREDIELKPENSKEFFDNLQFNLQYGIPEREGDILGYITSGSVMLSTDLTIEDYQEAEEYIRKYNSMLETIAKTKVTYKVLKSMADSERIDEMEERQLRTDLLKDETTFKSFNILSEVTHNALKEKTNALSDLEQAKRQIKLIADKFGLFDDLEKEIRETKGELNKAKTQSYIDKSKESKDKVIEKRVSRAKKSKEELETDKKYSHSIIIKRGVTNLVELQQMILKKLKEYGNTIVSVSYSSEGGDLKGTFVLKEELTYNRMQTIVDVVDRGQKLVSLSK